MKTKFAIIVALATALASPAFAAPPKHSAPVSRDTMQSYGQFNEQYGARQPDVVTFGNRVVGADPDHSIRTQLLHDPNPSEY